MQPLTADQTMHRCQWVCHEHAVCHWGAPHPQPWALANREQWLFTGGTERLSYLFLGFLNVSVSVAYYFYLNLIIWLISDSWTWMSFGNFVGHVTHYLLVSTVARACPPPRLSLWPFLFSSLWLLPHCSIDNSGSCCRGASLPAGETSVWISPAGTISLLNCLLLFMEHIGVCAHLSGGLPSPALRLL